MIKTFCNWYLALTEKKKDYVDTAILTIIVLIIWFISCLLIFTNY